MLASFGLSADTVVTDAELRMTFLVNFVRFTEWPTNSFRDDSAPVVIGVVGEDPFGGRLEDFVKQEQIGKRSMKIVRVDSPAAVSGVHVLYFPAGSALPKAALAGKPILTVGAAAGFARVGGMVELDIERQHAVLEINHGSAIASALKINPRLLKLARKVFP